MGGIIIKAINYTKYGSTEAPRLEEVKKPLPEDCEVHAANLTADASLQKTARIAGWLYLLLAVCYLFSVMYVDAQLYVPGDALATVGNIQASGWLFRLGIVGILVGQISFLLVANALYKLFKSVDEDQARLMLIMVIACAPVACLNVITQFATLLVTSGAGYLSAFEPAQLNALAMLFLDMQKYGASISEIFMGLWLIPLGWLVFKSGFFPRVLGFLLMIGSIGYLISSFRNFLVPQNGVISNISSVFLVVSTIAEFSFVFWLLLKGINIRRVEQGQAE